ncbi:MAG TPA: hypothetical protein VIS73_07470 [Rhodocyclaceae bacterium]
MSERKLIIPTEIKLCATCSYWDGERKVDDEINVVIVSESCEGTCLYREDPKQALTDVRKVCGCMWEDLRDPPAEGGGEAEDSKKA